MLYLIIPNLKHNMSILKSVINTNNNQVKNCLKLIPKKTKSILILGMSFKPEIRRFKKSLYHLIFLKSSIKFVTDPSKLPKKYNYKNVIFLKFSK